ncbi:MAG: type II toxin-antitoxin system RelE/ParE family toxin [Alphaproteobacteria bacterium]|jgi:toxin ParE1/3/4|nr:type II toxin-antitoxin system RelE/ParE family toxin [Alphaproteobacteria bacterium]
MRLIWTTRAESDLRDHVDFIARDSVKSAIEVEDRILEAVAGLVEFPQRGRLGETKGTRELPVSRTSLRVIYSLADGVVEILHVRHMARGPLDESGDRN